jgi:SAM-dependent methyltransferase
LEDVEMPLDVAPDVLARFVAMLHEDGHGNPDAWLYTAERHLCGTDVVGRTVLDVGSGRGLMALYLATRGARVYSMEPELDGSRSGMIEIQKRRAAALGLDNIEVVAADFNAWDPAGQRVDVVMSCASINHLFPSDRHALRDEATYRGYLTVVRKFRDVLADDGVALVSDASRYSLFGLARDLGIRRPWNWKRSNVNWRHHQQASTWRRIFSDAGFRSVRTEAPVPYRLRRLAVLARAAPVGFFLGGGFLLRADA